MHGYILKPVGFVRSSLQSVCDAPRQGGEGAPDAVVQIDAAFAPGVRDIQIGDRLIVITWLHLAQRDVQQVHPRDDESRPLTGVFSTRSSHRPNPLGLHEVFVRRVDGLEVTVGPIEAVEGTPVVDIKPVI